jgi:minor extracellular serine protease Vpr
MDSGTQWGPIDGTSAVSQRINADFGSSNPGNVYVAASGDEGTVPNHARAAYSTTPAIFNFNKTSSSTVYFQMWYTGGLPANVTLTMNDTRTSVTVQPGNRCATSSDNSIVLCTYLPGQQFYPWTSSGPDRAVWFNIVGHSGTGNIRIQATQSCSGTADAYGDATLTTPIISYTNDLTLGRLTDYSSTASAIVAGCFNVRTTWVDITGTPQSLTNEGATGALWLYSSGGPTRDGRSPTTSTYGGVDIVTPGGNSFAAYSPTSYWGDPTLFSFNLIQGGNGFYGRQSATSASAPILVGAVALLLQMNSTLTADTIRQYIHQTAVADKFTGTTPNQNWGTGKLNVLGAADLVAGGFHTNPALSVSNLTFPSTPVGITSSPMSVNFSNTGTGATDALGITTIAASGDFHIAGNTCGSSLAAGSTCNISVTFKPTQKGTRTGTLTIKDFNVNGPQTLALSGTGS